MRNVICILALLFAVYASKQDVTEPSSINFEELVNIHKKILEAILNDVLLFEKRIKQNLQVRFNDLRTQALLKVNNIINSAFENVNLSIEEGKKEGKKIDECYDYAKHNLETRKDNTIAALETCVQNGKTTMEAPLMNVANNIKEIKTLLTDLNAIIPKCYSSNHIKMQSCIAMNLVLIRSSLKQINSNAITLVNMTLTAKSIIIRTNSCAKNAPVDNLISTNNSKLIAIY
ncbi:glucosamine--fructose-6-phosphate aminotransferase [Lasius niger]|uniref:Glucosamine--fructose-6-phosphate aminotransferase n=1 Tax=Lasius niger TaxID=67767 RepID=A0A0J7L9J5_LASNI|nr:glucosamine--fructose-6-phosphate aminotransferase [Lasius niger]